LHFLRRYDKIKTTKQELGKGDIRFMIAHLNGEFETVDYLQNRSVRIYDNVEEEEYPLHWHNAIEIILPLTNGFRVICDGQEYGMEERDILLIPAGTLHNLKAQPGRRLILLCDNRAFQENPMLTDLCSVFANPLLLHAADGAEWMQALNDLLKEIYMLYANFTNFTEVYIYIKLLTFFVRIKEHQLHAIQYGHDEQYAEQMQLVLHYIEQNYQKDITLEKLAGIAGYSPYHFSRIFKKYSNTTFINFLNLRRIKAAELLLLQENQSITDIAMQVGFSSLTTFNRTFKNLTGYTPSAYKKLFRSEN